MRERLIFAGPLDGFAGSVHVSDVRSGSGARESGETGVAEERQDFSRRRGGLDDLGKPVPVAGLIGKNAEMAGRSGLDPERKIVAAHGPARGNRLREIPLAIFCAWLLKESGVSGVPRFLREGRRPLGLRFRADKRDFAEAFELAARAGVEKLIVTPSGRERFEFWKRVVFHRRLFWRVDYAANVSSREPP